MNSEWQNVKARRRKRRAMTPRPPYVSITRRGEIAMNAAAFKAIREPWNVALYYLPPPRPANFGHPAPLLHKEGWTRFADGVVAGGELKVSLA